MSRSRWFDRCDGLYAHFLFGDDAKSFKRVNSADSRSFPEDFVGHRSFAHTKFEHR